MGTTTILIIEDEADIAELVADRLRSEGFVTSVASDGPSGIEACRSLQPDLVVLDLMLPGIDGLEVCRRLQADRRVPVVMLTAKDDETDMLVGLVTAKDDETDMLVGLGVGADDYVTKPFSPRELVARIQAVLRRATPAEPTAPALVIGDVTIDEVARLVTCAGDTVHLTPTEFDLLWALASANGAVRSRSDLLHDVWGYRDGSGVRTVDSHIRALRRKLGDDLIRTVHSVGYAIDRQAPVHTA